MTIACSGNQILLKPNNSLSPETAIKVVSILAVMVTIVALGFMHIGAWLVLPFAGLEILAISYAFYMMHLHADDFECITIEGDKVVVEKRNYKKLTTSVFQRYWAQVNVRSVCHGKVVNNKNGLFISSHGKEVEFGGDYISDEQRTLLARELREKFKNT